MNTPETVTVVEEWRCNSFRKYVLCPDGAKAIIADWTECQFPYVYFRSVEPAEPEPVPEGGRLKHGLIVYDGGCQVGRSEIQEVYNEETKQVKIQDRPAAKSSTSVAASATVCRSCGCRKGPNTQAKQGCTCRCH